MIEIPKGTLVQIRQSVTVSGAVDYANVNRDLVAAHGWLWTVEYIDSGKEPEEPEEFGDDAPPKYYLYTCTSLATGYATEWFRYELRTSDEEEDTNGDTEDD